MTTTVSRVRREGCAPRGSDPFCFSQHFLDATKLSRHKHRLLWSPLKHFRYPYSPSSTFCLAVTDSSCCYLRDDDGGRGRIARYQLITARIKEFIDATTRTYERSVETTSSKRVAVELLTCYVKLCRKAHTYTRERVAIHFYCICSILYLAWD